MPTGRSIAGALLLAAAFLAVPADAAAPSGLTRLEQFLDRVQSLSARFRQVVLDASDTVVEESRGQLTLLRPGRFRWDYEEPFQRVVLADGERLWLYEADLEQVTVRLLVAGLGATPAGLLTGTRDVLADFEVVSTWSGESLAWVKLRPRAPDGDFESVSIAFDGARLSQLELASRLGQRTRVYLEEVRVNPPLREGAFRFEVPPGVDVIREDEL